MSVSSKNYHIFFVNQSSMTISGAWFLSDQLTLIFVINNLGKVEITLLIALLFSHGIKAENDCFGSGRVCPPFFGLIVSALNVAKQFFFSVKKFSVFFLLNH